jgi:HrpA-like RNA helicase
MEDSVEEFLSGGGGFGFDSWQRDPTTINNLGVVLSKIPVSPKYAKMLLASHKYEGLFPYAVMMVACMSVPEIYSSSGGAASNEALLAQSDEDEENMRLREDRDLITSIDLQREETKQKSLKRKLRE